MFVYPTETLVVIDLETTDWQICDAAGTLPEIVEVGAVLCDSECHILDRYSSLVRPRNLDNYTEYSERLTGIQHEALEDAPTWDRVWRDFAEFTGFNRNRLVAWGAYADIPILRQEYRRCRLGYPHNAAALDAMSIVYGFAAQWGMDLGRRGGPSLDAACERLGVERTTRHRALPDAEAAANVLRVLTFFEDELC